MTRLSRLQMTWQGSSLGSDSGTKLGCRGPILSRLDCLPAGRGVCFLFRARYAASSRRSRPALSRLRFSQSPFLSLLSPRLSSHRIYGSSYINTSITMSAPMRNDVEMAYKPQEPMQAVPSDAQLEVSLCQVHPPRCSAAAQRQALLMDMD